MVTIAIAEDNAADLAALKRVIAKHKNWKIILVAINGKDLLEQLQKLQLQQLPHILLLDINMPLIDGLTVASYCKLKYPTIKIIGVSSHTNENLIKEVLAEGATSFISKYFLYPNSIIANENLQNIDLLSETITATLQGKRYIDKLIVNEPNSITPSIATSTIIATNFKQLKQKHIEFAILNATGSLKLNEIALLMCVSEGAVKLYCDQLAKQFMVSNRHEVATHCLKYGITKLATYFDDTMVNKAWA